METEETHMDTEHSSTPSDDPRAFAIYADATVRMYGLIALGIFTTAAAIWAVKTIGIYGWLPDFRIVRILILIVVIVIAIVLLKAANETVEKGHTGLGAVIYIVSTGILGMFLSPVLNSLTTGSVALVFVFAGALFVAMALIGVTTKKDIFGLGSILLIGLLGVTVVTVVNLFLLRSSVLHVLISVALLAIFVGLTVWESSKMKELAKEAAMRDDEKAAGQVAVRGSIGFYLNITNISQHS